MGVPLSESLSIVLLAHNEAGNIEAVVRSYHELRVRYVPHAALIVWEDGSTDATPVILARLARELPVCLRQQEKRRGYGNALKDALVAAKTDLVFVSDADGQHDPRDLLKLLSHVDGYDIVGGYKHPRRDPLPRRVLSRGLNIFCTLLFSARLRDIDAGFKLFRREAITAVVPAAQTLRHCAMTELIVRAIRAGFRFAEIPVAHAPRPSGTTAIFTSSALPGILMHVFLGLLRIRLKGGGGCASKR